MKINSLIPLDAGQGWKLEMFEISEKLSHKVGRCIVVADGELIASPNEDPPIVLKTGELAFIDPEKLHSLTPSGKARFFSIDIPNSSEENFPYLDPKYFGPKISRPENYWVYDLIPGSKVEERWSLALIEIYDSPKHFHRIENEQFIVVNGILDIEIDGVHHILNVGEAIETKPGMVHQLKSANARPVRVLCFSFPAFDPTDKHYVD